MVNQEPLHKSLHYLLLISEVDDTEIFKICLEYWNALAADLHRNRLCFGFNLLHVLEGKELEFYLRKIKAKGK